MEEEEVKKNSLSKTQRSSSNKDNVQVGEDKSIVSGNKEWENQSLNDKRHEAFNSKKSPLQMGRLGLNSHKGHPLDSCTALKERTINVGINAEIDSTRNPSWPLDQVQGQVLEHSQPSTWPPKFSPAHSPILISRPDGTLHLPRAAHVQQSSRDVGPSSQPGHSSNLEDKVNLDEKGNDRAQVQVRPKRKINKPSWMKYYVED